MHSPVDSICTGFYKSVQAIVKLDGPLAGLVRLLHGEPFLHLIDLVDHAHVAVEVLLRPRKVEDTVLPVDPTTHLCDLRRVAGVIENADDAVVHDCVLCHGLRAIDCNLGEAPRLLPGGLRFLPLEANLRTHLVLPKRASHLDLKLL